MSRREPFDEIRQPQRHACEPHKMVVLRPAHPGDGHVAIAGRLDLLHAMGRCEPIELGDDLVEQGHCALRAEPLREFGEAHEIAEHH